MVSSAATSQQKNFKLFLQQVFEQVLRYGFEKNHLKNEVSLAGLVVNFKAFFFVQIVLESKHRRLTITTAGES